MVGRIVPELRGGEPLAPLLGLVVDGAPEVHLEALIDPLALPVSLGVVRRSVEELGTSDGEKFPPHGAGKILVAIRDDGVRDA